jgi:hypothetical protein
MDKVVLSQTIHRLKVFVNVMASLDEATRREDHAKICELSAKAAICRVSIDDYIGLCAELSSMCGNSLERVKAAHAAMLENITKHTETEEIE